MNWASWHDFFAMGGYAPYVWGSFAGVLLVALVELALLKQRFAAARLRGAR
jgi:heme exporter protein D